MNLLMSSVVRIAGALVISVNIVAVSAARLIGPEASLRSPSIERHTGVILEQHDAVWVEFGMIDRATGATQPTPRHDDMSLDLMSESPWHDERGSTQLAGRWRRKVLDGRETGPAVGLARFSFPDGQLIDQVATEVLPTTKPCWLAGTTARVVFAAGDGKLYRLDFEDGCPQAEPVRWNIPTPGNDTIFALEIQRAEGVGREDLFVASINLYSRRCPTSKGWDPEEDQGGTSSPTEIWWLQLDPEGRTVQNGGRLSSPSPGSNDERWPMVARSSDGAAKLFYLREREDRATSELVSTPVCYDAPSGRMILADRRARILASECWGGPIVLAHEGDWVGVLQRESRRQCRFVRVSTAEPKPGREGFARQLLSSAE